VGRKRIFIAQESKESNTHIVLISPVVRKARVTRVYCNQWSGGTCDGSYDVRESGIVCVIYSTAVEWRKLAQCERVWLRVIDARLEMGERGPLVRECR
jgi:hypothetical protein